MKLHNALDRIVGHTVKAGILRFLCDKNTGWTGRQIARELDISPTTSSKFLKDLSGEGVVFVKGVGRAYLYHLNDRSYVVRNILMPFFEREKGIVDNITKLVKKAALKSAKIESIAMFGSMAKKTATSRSDVDMLIIINQRKDKPKVEAGINKLAEVFATNYNTTVSPYILTVKQFVKRYHEKSPLITEILRSYKLLYGRALERIAS